MQNSSTMTILVFKRHRISIFFQKLKVAYNVLKAPKSIVIIEDKIECFQHDSETVHKTCRNICLEMVVYNNQKESEIHDNLVYQSTNPLVHN
jgi:hypothetical protein